MRRQREVKQESDLQERVVRIDRTRKTVKGGRISSSRVIAAVGDGRGHVGLGVGKARNAPEAIAKAMARAKKTMIRVPMDGYTVTHEVTAKVGGAIILLKPASRGTGIIAGGATRQIIEVSGIRDILTKSLGTTNPINLVRATVAGLQSLKTPEGVARMRGISVSKVLGLDQRDEAAGEVPAAGEA